MAQTILIIENDRPTLFFLKEILEAEGFVAIDANNGSIPIEQAQQQQLDLIICELMMYKPENFNILTQLRQNQITAKTPTIFLTAEIEEVKNSNTKQLKTDRFLRKPCTTEDLLQAIEREEFKIYYQPVMQLATDRITEVEALIRWQHPQRGLVFPADFLPLAEQTGLILPLGQWILEKACQETQLWRSQNISNEPLVLNVNLSIQQLHQPKIEQKIARILQNTGINPNCLKLEIAETTMLEKTEANLTKLQNLKNLGIKLAIDDFGKGFSMLNSFKTLPIDNLKIDRLLMNELGQNVKNTALVNAIIVFAKALNLTITAEGLETAQQLVQLQAFGCDCAQGYYFTKPLSYDAMSNFLSEGVFKS
jgi:EAL domain-containing protein (putative c-di-GMP-specific phosphodiesterase class I)